MATKERKCKKCGIKLKMQQVWSKGKYCSKKCYADDRWGSATQLGKISTRSKNFIGVAKLCQTGLTQAESARILGLSQQTIAGWFAQNGTDTILQNRVCKQCGKSLNGMKYRSNRKYCSDKCCGKAAYARRQPIPKQRKYEPGLRTNALELYWKGIGSKVIANHLNVIEGTMYSWVHDFGRFQERKLVREVLNIASSCRAIRNSKNNRRMAANFE